MKFSAPLFRCALAVWVCAFAIGCVPPSQSPIEDEKEPHFIEGKHAVNTMDYTGAIEEFEKAVEANPRNASAHFELGMLYEEKEPDPAAAIYHYQQFLKWRPNAEVAAAVQGRITNCKQDLAKSVQSLPASPGVQHDLEILIESNKQLSAEVEQWRAWYKTQQTNRAPQQAVMPIPPVPPTQAVQYVDKPPAQTVRSNSTPQIPRNVSRNSTSRPTTTYTVQPRDTLASISRKFNVKLPALAAANPGLDARKLRVGQTVNVP